MVTPDKGYAAVVMVMAYNDFDAYATAKKEVYLEQLAKLGWNGIPRKADRKAVDIWKARITRGDDRHPGGTV